MEKIARHIAWEDMALFGQLRTGFALTGNQEKTGIFPDDFKPPTCGVDELMDRAKFVKPALWGKIKNEELQSFSQELSDITVAEHEQKGWLGPPMRFEQLETAFQSKSLPVRRFAVVQKSKRRPIDDLVKMASMLVLGRLKGSFFELMPCALEAQTVIKTYCL